MSKPISDDPNACTPGYHWHKSRGRALYCNQCGQVLDKGEWGPLYDAQPTTPADSLEKEELEYLLELVYAQEQTCFVVELAEWLRWKWIAMSDKPKEVASDDS